MSYTLAWTRSAARDLRKLDRRVQDRIKTALTRYAEIGHGDVKPLQGRAGEWRLRVGKWRIMFVLDRETETLTVLRALPRGEAYR